MDTNEQNLPVVATPETPVQQGEVLEGVPTPYKVQDYEDAIPVGKSVAIVGGILLLIVGIFFLAKTSRPADLTPEGNQLDFSKMNAKQQQQQQRGQVAGAQTYGPQGAPPASVSPSENVKKTPTPTEAGTPTPTSSPTPKPTEASTPTPTPTNTPTQTPTETPSPTESVTLTPTTSPTP